MVLNLTANGTSAVNYNWWLLQRTWVQLFLTLVGITVSRSRCETKPNQLYNHYFSIVIAGNIDYVFSCTNLGSRYPHLVYPAEGVTVSFLGPLWMSVHCLLAHSSPCQSFHVPATLTLAQHVRTGGACLMGHGSQQMSANCILTVNSCVCALVSEGAPTTVVWSC